MRQKVDQIHTVHSCTPGKKGNPQEYQASWSFVRRSVHDFLFLSVLEATAHQKLRIITLPSRLNLKNINVYTWGAIERGPFEAVGACLMQQQVKENHLLVSV